MSIKTRITSIYNLGSFLNLYRREDSELRDMRPYKDLVITKASLEVYLTDYIAKCNKQDLLDGLAPEIKIFKNILRRYDEPNSRLSELDLELLISLIQLNIDEREHRSDKYAHDKMFDCIVDKFDLKDFVYNKLRNYFDYNI